MVGKFFIIICDIKVIEYKPDDEFSVCTLFDSELEDDVFVEPERAKVVHYCKPSGILIPN